MTRPPTDSRTSVAHMVRNERRERDRLRRYSKQAESDLDRYRFDAWASDHQVEALRILVTARLSGWTER